MLSKMKLNGLVVGILFNIVSGLYGQPHFSLDSLQVAIDVSVWGTSWQHEAQALLAWEDSGYRDMDIVPSFDLGTAVLLETRVGLTYKRYSVWYRRQALGIGVDFNSYTEPWDWRYQTREGFNAGIETISGRRSEHNFGIGFRVYKNWLLFLEHQRLSYEITPEQILVYSEDIPDFDFRVKSAHTGFGAHAQFGIPRLPLFVKLSAFLAPFANIQYRYEAENPDLPVRKFEEKTRNVPARSGFISLGAGLQLVSGLQVEARYRYQFLNGKHDAIDDTVQGVMVTLEYLF